MMCRRGQLQPFHIAWGLSLLGLFFVIILTANLKPRFRIVFEPFWFLYIGLLFDLGASVLFRRRKRPTSLHPPFHPAAGGGAGVRAISWRLHLLLLLFVAAFVAVLFLQEPGFGDDFTYWNFSFRLHERGLSAWLRGSFHDLRWPVWFPCWLIQAALGPGLLSYYGEPILYLIGGAALAFTFGRLITGSAPIAWACGLAFLFHPLLDTVSYRPMPDLSEGVWGAATVLCWWRLMQSRRAGASLLWAALTGACIYIAESNRITGAFIVPVLVLCTWLYARQRFGLAHRRRRVRCVTLWARVRFLSLALSGLAAQSSRQSRGQRP